MTPSPRRLYFDLGRGLAAHSRWKDAASALRQAMREEEAADADRRAILLVLADCRAAVGRPDESFHVLMEAALAEPSRSGPVLDRLRTELDPAIAKTHGDWAAGDWADGMRAAGLDAPDRAGVEVLLARMHAMRGELGRALARWDAAVEATGVGPDAARQLLEDVEASRGAGEGEPADARGDHLRGELLLSVGRDREAAEALFEAGKAYGRAEEHRPAVAVLAIATTHDPTLHTAYWYWADSIRFLAWRPDPPYQDEAELRAGVEVWDRGGAVAPPTEEHAWAYSVRALLLEALSMVANDGPAVRWEAVLNLEQALRLDPWNPDPRVSISRQLRVLGLNACAVVGAESTLEIFPDYAPALFELGGALAMVGDDRALGVLDRYRSAISVIDPTAEAQEGDLLAILGRFGDALPFVERAVEAEPENPWFRTIRGNAYQLAGRLDEAAAEHEWLYDHGGKPGQIEYRAWAAYRLGKLDEARSLYEELAGAPGRSAVDMQLNLFFCALLRGDFEEAERRFRLGLPALSTRRQALENGLELADVERRAAGVVDEQLLKRAIRRFRTILAGRARHLAARVYDVDAAAAELQAARAGAGEESTTWLAATAALARLRAETALWEETVDLYTALDGRFPEARDALVLALHSLSEARRDEGDAGAVGRAQARLVGLGAVPAYSAPMEVAEAEARAGALEAAVSRCRAALDEASDREAEVLLSQQLVRLLLWAGRTEDAIAAGEEAARAAQVAGDLPGESAAVAWTGRARAAALDLRGAVAAFRRSMELRVQNGVLNRTADVLNALADVGGTTSPAVRRVLGEAVALVADGEAAGPSRQTLQASRLGVAARGWPQPADAEPAYPIGTVAPLQLDVCAALFPDDERTPGARQMIDVLVPAIRERVESASGVPLPSLHINSRTDYPPYQYTVAQSDVQRGRGWVLADGIHCRDPRACEERGLRGREAADPLDGTAGIWLTGEADLRSAREAGLPASDPYEYMVRHVEAVVLRHLAELVGIQDVCTLIKGWQARSGAEDQQLADAVLVDDLRRVRFARVVRSLVAERVPVHDLGAILRRFVEADGKDDAADDVLESVRHALRARLPGADGSRELIGLAPGFEALLESSAPGARGERRAALVVSPETAERLRAAVLHGLGQGAGRSAVVVATPGLRLAVRRLLRDRLPDLPVLARSELLDAATPVARWVEPEAAVAAPGGR